MICTHDYPEKMPNLFNQIKAYLNGNTKESIYAGLQGLHALSARYEFELDEDRDPLHEIIRDTFGNLCTLIN